MAKRNPRKKRKKQPAVSKYKLINLVLFMVVITLSITIFAYYVILNQHNQKQTTNIQQQHQNEQEKKNLLPQSKQDIINKYLKQKYENKPLAQTTPKHDQFEEYTEELKKEYIHPPKEPSTFDESSKDKIKKITLEQKAISNKPKLAIIIDDVTLASQVKKIQNIGYTITMSFMPPTSRHKNSAKIAQGLPFYMIHFPLQAQTFKFEEENTLHVGDSYEKIEKRVAQVRQWYPDALYTNNHTGSKFTSDDTSMDYLMKALKKYEFIFMDSRTTSKTVVKKYAKKYNMPYLTRNIFLDNEKDYHYIQNQLKKAIKIAKKRGYAIAIGHPHSITLKVLKESQDLLEGLDLVYANKIPLQ